MKTAAKIESAKRVREAVLNLNYWHDACANAAANFVDDIRRGALREHFDEMNAAVKAWRKASQVLTEAVIADAAVAGGAS